MPYMICSGAVVVGLEIGDELHELVGFPVEVQPVQRCSVNVESRIQL
jgi:hypothetical protein